MSISNNNELHVNEFEPFELPISLATVQEALNRDMLVMILASSYKVGPHYMMAALTIDSQTPIREDEEHLYAEVLFPLEEFSHFKQYGEVIEDREAVKVTAEVKKTDILVAGANPLPKDL